MSGVDKIIDDKPAIAIVKQAPPEFSFKISEIGDLPLYNQDDDTNQTASVKRFKSEIEAATGLVIRAPEYDHSYPGVLKNAIDHGSRPGGKKSWNAKPTGFVGVPLGSAGTTSAQ